MNPFTMPSKVQPPTIDSQKSNSSLVQENPLSSIEALKKIANLNKPDSPMKSLFDFKENNHLKKTDQFLPTVPLPKTSFSFKTDGLFKIPPNQSTSTNATTGFTVLKDFSNKQSNFKITMPFTNPFFIIF